MDEYKNNQKSERVGPNQSQSQVQPPKLKSGQAQQHQLDPFDELSESGREACQQLLKIYKRAKNQNKKVIYKISNKNLIIINKLIRINYNKNNK